MKKINILLSIIIVILILIIYKLYNIYTDDYKYQNNEYYKYKYTYLEDIKDELNTGDLVLFSSYYFSHIRIASNKKFSHIGMIIKYNNVLYIIDMVNYDTTMPGIQQKDININELYNRITYYTGFVYIVKYNKNLSIENEKNIIKSITQNRFTFPYKKEILMAKYFFNIQNQYINKYKTCVEYIVHLMECGKIYNFKNIKIKNYMHEIIHLCNGTLYSEPIRVLTKGRNNYNKKNLCQ